MYVDGTLGGGGHTAELLERLDDKARVFGIDRDADAIAFASERLVRDIGSGRLTVIRGNAANAEALLAVHDVDVIDGLLLDLGVSSHQLDTAGRGFSHAREGALDMRMNQAEHVSGSEPGDGSAGALVNTSDERALRDLLFRYGEEPRARKIAAAIVAARPLQTTIELANVVRGAVPRTAEAKSLARVFQAIRIAVNRELEELHGVLLAGTKLVRPGGRLVVIAYHSLEDRMVKRFIRSGDLSGLVQRDIYGNALAPWKALGRVVKPDAGEIDSNPRARSARLRIAERCSPSVKQQ